MQDGKLGRHLGPRHDGHQRALGLCQRLGDGVDLSSQQGAGAGDRRVLGDAIGRTFGSVGRTKSVIHKDVAQGRQLARQRFGVFLLADIDAAVFQQHHLARLDLYAVDPIGQQRHLAPQQACQARGHRRQGVFGFEGPFDRAPQVTGHHNGRPSVQRHLDARHRGTDARVLGNGSLAVQRHIQVGTDENALATDKALGAQIGKAKNVHGNGSVSGPHLRRIGHCRHPHSPTPATYARSCYQPSPMCSGR